MRGWVDYSYFNSLEKLFYMSDRIGRRDFQAVGEVVGKDPIPEGMDRELLREVAGKAWMLLRQSGGSQALHRIYSLEHGDKDPSMSQEEYEAWKVIAKHVREIATPLLPVTDASVAGKASDKKPHDYLDRVRAMESTEYMRFTQQLLTQLGAYKATL